MPERETSGLNGEELRLTADEGIILSAVFQHGPQSRTDLARITQFSRSKVSNLVANLTDKQILKGINCDGGHHRKGKNLAVNQRLGYLVGIDIGTSSVDVALTDISCALVNQKSEASDVNDGPEHVLRQAVSMLEDILKQQNVHPAQILGIGVGIPGPVSYPSGEVIGGQFTSGWEGFKVQGILSKNFLDAVVKVDNDANLMAIGSHKDGLARGIDDFVFVKVGTGIGAGVYCRGHLYRGATSCAGHIGHTCVEFEGPICRCGNRGCLEALAGGSAIQAAAEKAAEEGISTILAKLKKENHGMLSAVQVGDAATLHDQAAQQIVIKSATLIGFVLAGVVNLYNPQLIVLGGGISKLGDLFLAEIRREVLKRAYSYTTMGLRIDFSPILDCVGVMGAAHFIRDWVFTVEGKPLSLAV